MREFDETVDDLRVALDDLRTAAGHEPHHRRALKMVLNELYRVHEYRLGRSRVHKTAYYTRAESCDAGKITLGILYLRGVLTHHLVRQVSPTIQPLYPGENVYPSEDLYPGTNFMWISGADLSKVHTPESQFARWQPFYDSYVGGQLMLRTIRQATDFLLSDPAIVKLHYT